MVNLRAGKWRGKSGAIYNVMDDLYSNSYWPFHDDAPLQENKRFWKADGTAWTGYVGGGDDLVAEVHAFKVSDRVLCIENADGRGKGKFGYVTDVDDYTVTARIDAPFDGWGDEDREWHFAARQLELAPLTIEAGKFYMTRDGRRVGPLTKGAYDLYGAPQDDLSSTGQWYSNGRCLSGNKEHHADLISEAPAITANAAAEVDNLADEYGGAWKAAASEPKFKVGDKVRYNTKKPSHNAEYTDGLMEIESIGDIDDDDVTLNYLNDRGYTQTARLADIELATKPDSNLSVTITADTSELDAEIDRVKRRLKKLAKRARKLSISLDYSDLREAA